MIVSCACAINSQLFVHDISDYYILDRILIFQNVRV